MSRCRCEEIVNCRLDICQINDLINQLKMLDDQFINLSDDLESLAHYSKQAYSSEKIDELTVAITGLDKNLIDVRDSFLHKLISKQSELSAKLSEMELEDQSYHEEENRRLEAAAQKR